MVSGLLKELNGLGPRWWELKAGDAIDRSLLAPPPSAERKHLLEEIFCCDLDSFLLAAVIGAGNLHDRTGQLQHQARLLMAALLLEEGVTVLSREQAIQSAVLQQAGIPLATFLHSSPAHLPAPSPAQLDAAARVSALVAFQHLFELHAKHVMPLVDGAPPLSQARLSSARFEEEVEAWQAALEALGPWLEAHMWRLASSEAQMALHSIIASATRGKPELSDTYAHDAHSFLFHIIKLCTSFGLDGLYERVAHPKGVHWVLSTYMSRISVYQAAYHELNLEQRLGDGSTDFKFAMPKEVAAPEKAAQAAKLRTSLQISVDAPQRRPATATDAMEPPGLRRMQSAKMTGGIANWALHEEMSASSLQTHKMSESITSSPAMVAEQAVVRLQKLARTRRTVRYSEPDSGATSPSPHPARSPSRAWDSLSPPSGASTNPMASPSTELSTPHSRTTGKAVRAAAMAFKRNSAQHSRRADPKEDAELTAARSFRVPEPKEQPSRAALVRPPVTNWWEPQRGRYTQLDNSRQGTGDITHAPSIRPSV